MLGEEGLVAPNDPAYAGIDETEFVAGGVYRLDAGEFEVPTQCKLGLLSYLS